MYVRNNLRYLSQVRSAYVWTYMLLYLCFPWSPFCSLYCASRLPIRCFPPPSSLSLPSLSPALPRTSLCVDSSWGPPRTSPSCRSGSECCASEALQHVAVVVMWRSGVYVAVCVQSWCWVGCVSFLRTYIVQACALCGVFIVVYLCTTYVCPLWTMWTAYCVFGATY